MPSRQFLIASFAAALGAAVLVPAAAADLSIPRLTAAVRKPAPAPKQAKDKPRRAQRDEREAQRKIVTYKLYHDPVLRLNGALGASGQAGMPQSLVARGAAAGAAMPRPAPPAMAGLRLKEPEIEGIDFGCSDKPFRGSGIKRELTACFRHSVDGSWKAQTYVSREITESSQKWGGGLAVRYIY